VPGGDLYRKQVVKQADLVLAMHLRGGTFTEEQKAANFAYYERLTVRDSAPAVRSCCILCLLCAGSGGGCWVSAYARRSTCSGSLNEFPIGLDRTPVSRSPRCIFLAPRGGTDDRSPEDGTS
jgi:hypothetical protein